jgi:hypothetical protein
MYAIVKSMDGKMSVHTSEDLSSLHKVAENFVQETIGSSNYVELHHIGQFFLEGTFYKGADGEILVANSVKFKRGLKDRIHYLNFHLPQGVWMNLVTVTNEDEE